MKVLVIIVTYNAMRWINKCLTSLNNSLIPVDCIIIDNNSKDNTIETIKEQYSYCRLIENKENLGFGKANNIGLQYAIDNNYDYVYLLNQDAWIFPDTLSLLIKAHKHNPKYGILSPLQMNASKDKLDKNFQICCSKEMISDCLCGHLKDIYPSSFVMAAHWLIPKEALLKVGGFSPSFPHYGEDHNYVHRMLLKNCMIGIVPAAKAVHDREFRNDSKALKIRKAYLRSIVNISNPNIPIYKNLFAQPLILFRRCIKFKTFKGFKYIFQLLINYPNIIRNRNISLKFSFLKKK